MAWPWDNEQEAVDALRESSAPAAATGGAGDWMTALPMLLGAGASIASPNMANAGNAVMQMGDYFRRQRMEDLSGQRFQQQQAQQQRAYDLAQQHLKMQQQQAALKEQRRQDTMRNFQQMVDLRAARTGMDPRTAFAQMQGLLPQMETESLPQAVPLINELNTAMRGQQQAEAALPYYIPGPQREQLASNAGWGIAPIAQGMEQMGYGIGNIPGGDETLTKRQERSRDHAKAALEEVSYAARERALRDPAFAQTLTSTQLVEMNLMNKLDSRPDAADRAASFLSDGKFPYAGDFIKAGGSQAVLALNNEMTRAEGEHKAGVYRAETGPAVERHRATSAIDTAADYQRAVNRQPLEIAKQRALAQATVDIHQDTPITDPSRLRAFMDRTTLRVPPAGITPRQLQSSQWIARPENFQEKTFFVTNGHIETLLKHVLDTGKEYYPPSTGNPEADLVNTTQAAAMYKIKARNTRLAGQQDKIQADLTLFARNAGDVGNIAIVEAARQASGLALGGGVTRERALGALLSARKQSEMLAAQYGIELPPLEPGLQKQITEFEDTQRRREDAAAKAAATGAKGGFETPGERRRQRGAPPQPKAGWGVATPVPE